MPPASDTPAIPSSLRTLYVLEALSRAARPLTATEVNTGLHLPVPTILSLVATLEEEGFLTRDIDGRSYLPGPRLRGMARAAMLG